MGFDGWSGMNDATAQMGVQFGKSAVAAGQEYVEKNVSVRKTDSRLMTVHEVSPATTDQNELLGHELLRSEQTPAHPVSVAT